MRSLLITSLLLLITTTANARGVDASCSVHGLDVYDYSASLERQVAYRYDMRGEKTESHNLGVLVNGCEKAAGKFLMVGFGVNDFSLNASTYDTVYHDGLDKLKCSIANNTLSNPMSDEERASIHKRKTDFLRKCVETTIGHNSAYPLKYRAKQVGCTVRKVSPQRAIIEGGFCFFKINKDSEFVVSHKIKDECLNDEYLKENNISLREINAATTFGVAGRPTGTARDLELLPSKLFNFTLEPTEKHMPISDDWGRNIPQLPAEFEIPGIEFGDVKLRNLRGASLIKFPLLVDNNNCEKKSSNGVTTSTCNYSKPVVAEVVFSKVENGKKEYLKSWYDGAVAIANWQGLLDMPAQRLKGIELEKGARYNVELVFRDPKTDFTMYNKSVTPLFMPLPGVPTMDFAASLLSGVPSIQSAKPIHAIETHDMLPDFGVIRDFGQYSGADGADAIQTLSKFRFWPQYFDKACKDSKCVSISSKPYMKMSLSFTLGEEDFDGNFTLKQIVKSKQSRFERKKTQKVGALPKVTCPWDDF